MLIFASQMQEQEVGDGTNSVIILAAALLEHAEELIRMVNQNRINFILHRNTIVIFRDLVQQKLRMAMI